MQLILSLFPGIDLLGRAFELEGFCVVRGPDSLWGGDIRDFIPPAGRFDGVIAGSPCQDFSGARRTPPTGYGLEMLGEFARVVYQASPDWWLLENVTRVPDVVIDGYAVQRFNLNARECGMRQRRPRAFQFGSKRGLVLIPERTQPKGKAAPVCLASEGADPARRTWPDFCELQGLPRGFSLPGMTIKQKYKAVGNGVPIPMGRTVARAILGAKVKYKDVKLCPCECGRILRGKQKAAGAACRKRLERRRKRDRSITGDVRAVTYPPSVRNQATTSQALSHLTVTVPGLGR